jgi:hypothetical protein
LASRRTSPPCGSVSSSISPTTSSMMSSTVTIPVVDHHRERGALALKVGQQVVQRLGLGHDRHLAHERLDRRVRPLDQQQLGERIRVHDPFHAVAVVVLGDDEARVA